MNKVICDFCLNDITLENSRRQINLPKIVEDKYERDFVIYEHVTVDICQPCLKTYKEYIDDNVKAKF